MSDLQAPGPRHAVRALVMDGRGRVLLVESEDHGAPEVRWWELPGGGIEPDETAVAALTRELREETGLVDVEIGPPVWTWRATWTFSDRVVDQRDVVHRCVLRSDAAVAPAPLHDEGLLGHRWLSLAEIAALERAGEAVIPAGLAGLVADLPPDGTTPTTLAPGELPPLPGSGSPA